MAIGIVILTHRHLHRTCELARTLASRNVRVVVHVDANTEDSAFDWLQKALAKNGNIKFAPRLRCDWGTFSLVEAGLKSAELLLKTWPGVSHVAQISGSCIPIRPIEDLSAFLDNNIGRDFAESVCARDGNWVVGGLSEERFSFYFPFSWRKQRWLFDRSVAIQRALGVQRRVPDGLSPHIGSQWWCLSAATLRAILADPRKGEFDSYFRQCWIPDEAYVPTLVRKFSKDLVPTSLTLSKFDDQGKPHVFYDDHAQLLEQSDQFFARKIWQGADKLYDRFLRGKKGRVQRTVRDDLGLQTIFDDARRRRCQGRQGRLTAGRFPAAAYNPQPETCRDYKVDIGLGHIFDGEYRAGAQIAHGRLFKKNSVEVGPVKAAELGGIVANPGIRDLNPEQYLCNLLWNARSHLHSVSYELSDGERMGFYFANDPNANLRILRGSWILDLFARPDIGARLLRTRAKRLFKQENKLFGELQKTGRKDVQVLTFGDVIETGGAVLATEGQGFAPSRFRNFDGFRGFLSRLEELGVSTAGLGDLPRVLPGEVPMVHDDAVFAAE